MHYMIDNKIKYSTKSKRVQNIEMHKFQTNQNIQHFQMLNKLK